MLIPHAPASCEGRDRGKRTRTKASTARTRPSQELVSLDPQAVSYDAEARSGHGGGSDHRVEEPERRQGNRRYVVEERPEHVLLDGLEGQPGQLERFDDLERMAFHQHDISGLDGDVRASADRDAEIGLHEGRGVIDAVADK